MLSVWRRAGQARACEPYPHAAHRSPGSMVVRLWGGATALCQEQRQLWTKEEL